MFRSLLLLTLLLGAARALAADYFIDSQSGDDARSGLSPDEAWLSLEKVNATTFEPGDRILFRNGGRWDGTLVPRGSGRVEEDGTVVPIVIGRYGDEAEGRPRIDGGGRQRDALLVENVEFWEISGLRITNLGEEREEFRTGVRVSAVDFGKMRHIRLDDLHVHDVNGDLRKSHEGCGIYFEARGRNGTHFDGLWIENCHVERTDRNGICQRGGRTRSVNVVIRGNLLEDIGGDGIKLWGTNGGLVEHNVVRGARARCEDHAAGIWPFDCDDTVIQFNEVYDTKGIMDGQGFDADYNCRRTLIQYNYSHNNEGGFLLVCGPGRSFHEGTVIRYNISVHDGVNRARVFHFGGRSDGTLVHNNTIIVGSHQDLPMMLFTEWDGGVPRDARFLNNLFIVEQGGAARYEFRAGGGHEFEGNWFVGRHDGLPEGQEAREEMPPLQGPLEPVTGIDNLQRYQPRDGADFPRGVAVPDAGGRDFFGRPLPDGPLAVGAAEPSAP